MRRSQLYAAPWYGLDRERLTYTGMIEVSVKTSFALAMPNIQAEIGAGFHVLRSDDPLPRTAKRVQIYFHDRNRRAYIWFWRTVRVGSDNLPLDARDLIAAEAIRETASRFPRQAQAIKETGSFLITSSDANFSSVVPAAASFKPAENTICFCWVFPTYDEWPEDQVERFSRGGMHFVTKPQVGFDDMWDGVDRTKSEDLYLRYIGDPAFEKLWSFGGLDGYISAAILFIHEEDDLTVLGIHVGNEDLYAAVIEEGEVIFDAHGFDEISEGIGDREFEFSQEHLDAAALALAKARKRKQMDHPEAIAVMREIAKRSTSTLVWPTVAQIKVMVSKARGMEFGS